MRWPPREHMLYVRVRAAAVSRRTASHQGRGNGSCVYADVATRTSVAITKTRLTPHFKTAERLTNLVAAELSAAP
ncbi:hypothetical protein MAGR_00280 [Mycolicibacterium agri]|uniref:Uncharacterized protein n=1 Tax=Mycolicibacterium agri TaxID=36811 RepID=A0A7I9VTL6_MYCAG|nr:hypothetical protein MAGR_00280 [Mycolicibacterium agri]